MVDVLGTNVPIDVDLNVSGFVSSSWIWVAFVLLFGVILIATISIILYFKTFNRKIEFYDNLSGQGYYRIATRRARVIKLGKGGDEILKVSRQELYLNAYGKKMGRNLYWFAKGPDGYYYNVTLGDLDSQKGILDIEPVDKDVRMMHVALDRLSHENYGQKSKMPMILLGTGIFIAIVILLVGMYVVAGRFVEAASTLTSTAQTNKEVVEALKSILQGAGNLKTSVESGIKPA
jgi:hypothetical protein